MNQEKVIEYRYRLSPERESIFRKAEADLRHPIEVYELGESFEGLPDNIARVTALDVTKVPGCHYGVKNVFVPIIKRLEQTGFEIRDGLFVPVTPRTAIAVESSTGNGIVAAFRAAKSTEYSFLGVMPDALSSENRYKDPSGDVIEVIRTAKGKYASGMPPKLFSLIRQNPGRFERGEKIYVPLNHAVAAADITLQTMSDIGRQLLEKLKKVDIGVFTMGNGASICSIGEEIKLHCPSAEIFAAESFASGIGFNRFALSRGLPSYQELFGIQPEHPDLMAEFSLYGSNVSLGKTVLPLQERAFSGNLMDKYFVVTDEPVVKAYRALNLRSGYLKNMAEIPNLSDLPSVLYDNFGNTSLANISVASRFTEPGKTVVAMAYDGRQNY